MKTAFLQKNGSEKLLVFFNGWSRSASDAAALQAPFDVLEVHDYTNLDPAELFAQIAPYPKISLVAWSLGVWAAAVVFEHSAVRFESALALNGTLYPVHPEFGIAPEIFDGTIANWLVPAARDRFLRRMAGNGAAAQRLPETGRSPEDQQTELAAIRKQASERPVPCNLYTHAVLGRQDRIIPFAAQDNFWKTQSVTKVSAVDLPHYPFDGCSCWKDVPGFENAR